MTALGRHLPVAALLAFQHGNLLSLANRPDSAKTSHPCFCPLDHTRPDAFAVPLFFKEYPSMNREDKSKARPRYSRWVSIGFVNAGIASIFGFAAMVFIAVTRIQSDRGMETYHTFWLVEDSSIGFLTFVGCAVVALIFSAALRFRDYLRWRKFEKRFNDQSENG